MRIALLEARMSGELAELFRRRGHEVVCTPALREMTLDGDLGAGALLSGLKAGEIEMVVFQTGVGVTRLFQAAEQQGFLPDLLDALRGVTTVCRGPKPVAVLRRHEVPVRLTAPEPHTTAELLAALAEHDITDKGVAVLHYGERNEALTSALHQRGARVRELTLYEWLLPEDLGPLTALVESIIAGEVDAVAFTTRVQARHLFQVAEWLGRVEALREALRKRVTIAAVGPTTTETLEELGVPPHVIPEHPKMGHLVTALDRYLAERAAR